MTWNAPADRGNKLVHAKGFGHQSPGGAGRMISLRSIDSDTRTTVAAMLARGMHRDQVAARTGAPLRIVRVIEASLPEPGVDCPAIR